MCMQIRYEERRHETTRPGTTCPGRGAKRTAVGWRTELGQSTIYHGGLAFTPGSPLPGPGLSPRVNLQLESGEEGRRGRDPRRRVSTSAHPDDQ